MFDIETDGDSEFITYMESLEHGTRAGNLYNIIIFIIIINLLIIIAFAVKGTAFGFSREGY